MVFKKRFEKNPGEGPEKIVTPRGKIFHHRSQIYAKLYYNLSSVSF